MASLLLSLCGCDLGVDLGTGIGQAFACAFTFDFGPEIESDQGRLDAKANCELGADCSDLRTVAVDSSFDLQIKVSEAFDGTALRAEATGAASTEGFEAMLAHCRGRILEGSVRFDEIGAGSIVVYSNDREIDRFTAVASEVARVEVQYGNLVRPFFGAEEWFKAGEKISVDTVLELRVFARNEAGERLVGATPTWWIDDPSIAEIASDDSADAASVLLEPKQLGTTMVHVLVGNKEQAVTLEVTKVVSIDQVLAEIFGDAGTLDDDAGTP